MSIEQTPGIPAATDRRLRRLAKANGYSVAKGRGRWAGTYSVLDAEQTGIVAMSVTIEEAEHWVTSIPVTEAIEAENARRRTAWEESDGSPTAKLDRAIAGIEQTKFSPHVSGADRVQCIQMLADERRGVPDDAPQGRLVNVTISTLRTYLITDEDGPNNPFAVVGFGQMTKGERQAIRERMLSCLAEIDKLDDEAGR
jgi:hypothetical protein